MSSPADRRWWRGLLLAAIAACLNPQPDDNPLAVPSLGDDAAPETSAASGGNSNEQVPLLSDADPSSAPPMPQAPPAPSAPAGILDADAGPPPALSPDGGSDDRTDAGASEN